MIKDVSFSDFMTDTVRLLFLIDSFKNKKSFMLTDNRIKLYDYYLKFPKTMLANKNLELYFDDSLDEYYSFFHWQPNVIRYRKSLNFLLSKGLITKAEVKGKANYSIAPQGETTVQSFNNDHAKRWSPILHYIVNSASKMSDSGIDREIRDASSVYNRIKRQGDAQ